MGLPFTDQPVGSDSTKRTHKGRRERRPVGSRNREDSTGTAIIHTCAGESADVERAVNELNNQPRLRGIGVLVVNRYVREEELIRQFGEFLKPIRMPHELAGELATGLREPRG